MSEGIIEVKGGARVVDGEAIQLHYTNRRHIRREEEREYVFVLGADDDCETENITPP